VLLPELLETMIRRGSCSDGQYLIFVVSYKHNVRTRFYHALADPHGTPYPEQMLDKLDADLGIFRKAFNQRVLYFRQLQEISDSVAEVEFEGSRHTAFEETKNEKEELDVKINRGRAHQRYLDNLADNQEGDKDEEDECCTLCRCEFIRGFITMWYEHFVYSCHGINLMKPQRTCILRGVFESMASATRRENLSSV
jgi:hypothetical protein